MLVQTDPEQERKQCRQGTRSQQHPLCRECLASALIVVIRHTCGKHPGTKLNGIPMAMTNSATSLELSWKTGPRILVEKYMTSISEVMVDSHLVRFRKLAGQTVRLQPHKLTVSSVKSSTKILTSFPNDSILSLEKPHYA